MSESNQWAHLERHRERNDCVRGFDAHQEQLRKSNPPGGYTFNTLRFKEIDVAARELEVDLKFKSPDGKNVKFPISNADARRLVEALQSYLSEVREWRIRDLVQEIQMASDDSIDQIFDLLKGGKSEF